MEDVAGKSKKQVIHSIVSDRADWTFLDEWFADDPATLVEMKEGLARAAAELLPKNRTDHSESPARLEPAELA